jgi:hypothetical protein
VLTYYHYTYPNLLFLSLLAAGRAQLALLRFEGSRQACERAYHAHAPSPGSPVRKPLSITPVADRSKAFVFFLFSSSTTAAAIPRTPKTHKRKNTFTSAKFLNELVKEHISMPASQSTRASLIEEKKTSNETSGGISAGI